MLRMVLGIAVAVVAMMPAVGVADDQAIADYIKSRLQVEQQRGNLSGFNVDMRVDRGTVWFTGFVANSAQEKAILSAAQGAGHLGVVQVVDDIEIQGAGYAASNFRNDVDYDQAFAPQRDSNTMAQQVGYQQQVGSVPVPPSFQQTPPTQVGQPLPYAAASTPLPFAQAARPGQVPAMQASGPNRLRPQDLYGGGEMMGGEIMAGQAYGGDMGMSMGSEMYAGDMYVGGGVPMGGGGPPMASGYAGGGAGGPAMSGAPNMPGYAWPGYAAAPNYAALQYPQQYSPSAWPYIGPFYPYPQVPLGWRKVTLEWDDGWWMLDFKDK